MVAIEVMAEISLESSPNRGCQGSTEGSSKDWRTVATVWVFLMMNPRSGLPWKLCANTIGQLGNDWIPTLERNGN